MAHERFVYLVTRRLADEATAEELEELDSLLLADSQLREVYTVLFHKSSKAEVTNDPAYLKAMQAYTAHSAKRQLAEKYLETTPETVLAPTRRQRIVQALSWCAAAILLVFLWFVFDRVSRPDDRPEGQTTEVTTDKGMRKHCFLPDGTEVWLNADSRLVYMDEPHGRSRKVNFTGEAYFKVEKNAEKPYIIHTGNIQVAVLGTSFNLRAYPDEENTETALIAGSVAITVEQQQQNKIYLRPGEKLAVRNADFQSGEKPADGPMPGAPIRPKLLLSELAMSGADSVVIPEILWKENQLVFDDERLDRVLSKISRWYDVEIHINKEELRQRRFTARFENKTIEQVLDALQYSGGFKYRLVHDTIYIN